MNEEQFEIYMLLVMTGRNEEAEKFREKINHEQEGKHEIEQ